ncbi:unnamed protein product [Diamesa tonsa]
MILLWVVILMLVVLCIYKWASQHFNYFKDRDIKFIKPVIFLGSNAGMLLSKMSVVEVIQKMYNSFPDKKIVGSFHFRTPIFIIRDLEIMKLIWIKHFDHFTDHIDAVNEDMDPLQGNSLILLKGQKWKDMRSLLSPAFTGSKMRQMFDLVCICTKASIGTLEQQIKEPGQDVLEMRKLFAKFTVDVIASCAFGLDVNSFKNPDNDFQKVATTILKPNSILLITKYILLSLMPNLMKKLNISLSDRKTIQFFRKTVSDTMRIREKEGILRPDMINLLMEAKKGSLNHSNTEDLIEGKAVVEESINNKAEVPRNWSDDELVAQCMIFFTAGFDTTSTALSFSAYELALNPDFQEKLRAEVTGMEETLNGKNLCYDNIQKMILLDQFICEILRMYPPAPALERTCVKDFTFNVDGKDVTIEKKTSCLVPVAGFHSDPQYFANPEKFDPDRFSDENIGSINMNAFMPFGMGPRACIGSRFALMKVKCIIYYMIQNFSFEVCEKTTIPLKYTKSFTTLEIENGTWVQLKPVRA